MFSQKNIMIVLLLVVVAMSYQTITLLQMTKKLQQASFDVGNSPSVINLNDNGSTPEMVGGC